ncbi:MAG: glycosyltransferase [Bacillota bacterium]|nr:glycosyltransferase [Bacillota bacterium]
MRTLISIVAYQNAEEIKSCLAPLCQDPAFFLQRRLAVVDNGPGHATLLAVQREVFPGADPSCRSAVELIPAPRNLGWAGGHNLALTRMAASRYLLLLNPDAVVTPQVVAGLEEFLEAHPAVGAVGPALFDAKGQLQRSIFPLNTPGRGFFSLLGLEKCYERGLHWLRGEEWQLLFQAGKPVVLQAHYLSGAVLLVRRQALAHLSGHLDQRYFLYYDDEDLCREIRRGGFQVAWHPGLAAVHLGGRSRLSSDPVCNEARKLALAMRAKELLYEKWYGAGLARLVHWGHQARLRLGGYLPGKRRALYREARKLVEAGQN